MGGELAKAYLKPLEGKNEDQTVEFAFNPTQFSIARTINYKAVEQKGVDSASQEFAHGERTLDLEIFVDEYETDGNAADFVEKIEKLTLVDKETEDKGKKPRPPYVIFGWGKYTAFQSLITSLNVSYTLFHEDGRPARAKVKLSLKEAPDPDKDRPQNPTSLGGYGIRSHRVNPGETLDVIAYQELGDAKLWPQLAELNGIDDPWRLTPGRHLRIARVERPR